MTFGDEVVCANFKGVNRLVAPHLLTAELSPESFNAAPARSFMTLAISFRRV